MRARGLKLRRFQDWRLGLESRPYAGAWIETAINYYSEVGRGSRPYAGAWIETRDADAPVRRGQSRPYAGAWIETRGLQN